MSYNLLIFNGEKFYRQYTEKVIFVEFCTCRVFISELINYTTEIEKRLKTAKNAFFKAK